MGTDDGTSANLGPCRLCETDLVTAALIRTVACSPSHAASTLEASIKLWAALDDPDYTSFLVTCASGRTEEGDIMRVIILFTEAIILGLVI